MGLFDRWVRPASRRYEFADSPIADRPIVVDRDGRAEYARQGNADSWLWLLLIPLFFLLLLGAYTYLGNPDLNTLKASSQNALSRLFNRQPILSPTGNAENNAVSNNNGLTFGVGGSAPTVTPTPTRSASQSVQSASGRKIPAVAPVTGRGER